MADHNEAPISAFITNLGKYNEGELVGKWHPFPTTKEEIQQTFKEIGIDGVRYEEFFCTDYETNITGLYDHLPEYANLDELNYLAAKIEELQGYEADIYEAVIESGEYCGSMEDLINLAENLDHFDFLPGVDDDADLGYYWIEDSGVYDLKAMGNLASYIDYEKFGRDIRLDEGGTFTNMGYLGRCDGFDYDYGGIEDIPDEYKVFAFPEREEKAAPEQSGMKVLLVEPGKEAREAVIGSDLKSMQAAVGGTIQAVCPYEDLVALVCNDEGKVDGLPLNRALYDENGKMYDIVAGNFFVCGLSDDGFQSLSPELMDKFWEKFRAPEKFVSLCGKIIAVKEPVANPKQRDKGLDGVAPPKKSHDAEL